MLRTALILLILACASADDGRAQVARQWLEALAKRDAQSVYALVDPEVIRSVVSLHGTLRETRELIQTELPKPQQKAALEAAPLPEEGGPEELFAALFTREGAAVELGVLDGFSMRPRSIEGDMVTTLGGDVVSLVKDESGGWRVALSSEDKGRLAAIVERAEANRDRVKHLIGRFDERRFGKK